MVVSKLDELIEKMCPKGIEKVTLKSFCDISTGKGVTNKEKVCVLRHFQSPLLP